MQPQPAEQYPAWQASQKKKPARWRRWLKIAGLVIVALILLAFAINFVQTGNPFLSVQMISSRATGTAVTVATNIAAAQIANTRLALQPTLQSTFSTAFHICPDRPRHPAGPEQYTQPTSG